MSNEQIVEQIQNGADVTANQEKLWLKNRKFVLMIIKSYCGFTDGLEDLEQQGFLGLITAAMKYCPDKGVKFITYSAYWIKQSIFRYHDNCSGSVRVPAYMKSNIRKYERYRQDYRNQNSNYPADEELCRELKMSRRSLERLERTIYNMKAVSLDAPAARNGDMDTALIDCLKTDEILENALTYSVYRKELHRDLQKALELLDMVTRQMIYSVYYQGYSRARTAELFGCSRQNVNERIGKGFYRILHSSHRETLESYMEIGYRYKENAYSRYADLDSEADNEFLV